MFKKFIIPRHLFFALGAALLFHTPRALSQEVPGTSKMTVVYPAENSQSESSRPGITVDPTSLHAPLDPSSVRIFLDGVNVTGSAEIAPSFIYYVPPAPLAAGEHAVRIEAASVRTEKDENGADKTVRIQLDPLVWRFTVGGGAAAPAARPSVEGEEGEADLAADVRSNTHGRLTVSSDTVDAAVGSPSPLIDTSRNFAEKEGWKTNSDFYFSNVTEEGRSLIGSFHRETQNYTDREIDKLKLNYRDKEFEANMGDFWIEQSDLSLLGTELRGLELKTADGPWDLSLYGGRSVDPANTGQSKQSIGGLSAVYQFEGGHKTRLNAIAADDRIQDADLAPGGASQFETNGIVSLVHEYEDAEGLRASVEYGVTDTDTIWKDSTSAIWRSNDRQEAAMAKVSKQIEKIRVEAAGFKIGPDYLPISGGGARLTESDREGYSLGVNYRPKQTIDAGAEYEDYDRTRTGDQNVNRYSAYVAVSPTGMLRVTARYSQSNTDGANLAKTEALDSESMNASFQAVYSLPDAGNFKKSRIAAVYQRYELTSDSLGLLTGLLSGANSATDFMRLDLATSWSDRLGLRFSIGQSDTDSLNLIGTSRIPAAVETTTMDLGFQYKAIPSRLTVDGGFESTQNDGSGGATIDNEEERLKLKFNYAVNRYYTLGLGMDFVDYKDRVTAANSYEQDIIRTSVDLTF